MNKLVSNIIILGIFFIIQTNSVLAWTDNNLDNVPIKAQHLNEIRTKINDLEVLRGISSSIWTNGNILEQSDKIRSIHFLEIVTDLKRLVNSFGGTALSEFQDMLHSKGSYPDTDNDGFRDDLGEIGEPIKMDHIYQLRQSLEWLQDCQDNPGSCGCIPNLELFCSEGNVWEKDNCGQEYLKELCPYGTCSAGQCVTGTCEFKHLNWIDYNSQNNMGTLQDRYIAKPEGLLYSIGFMYCPFLYGSSSVTLNYRINWFTRTVNWINYSYGDASCQIVTAPDDSIENVPSVNGSRTVGNFRYWSPELGGTYENANDLAQGIDKNILFKITAFLINKVNANDLNQKDHRQYSYHSVCRNPN